MKNERHFMISSKSILWSLINKNATTKLIFLIFLIFNNSLLAQFFKIPGTPLIKNFTEEEVKTNLVVFDISQNSTGEMYFATAAGLLEYDGIRWKTYKFGAESDLRSVLYKDNNHIYTSGHGGFGYWSKNNKGNLKYTSLFFSKTKSDNPLLPVFISIKEINGKILFQTFQQIYIYDPISKKLDSFNATKGFKLLFSSLKKGYIQDADLGLFEINGKKLSLVEGTNKEELNIVGVFAQNLNELLIVTKGKGIWTLKNKKLQKNISEINSLIDKYLINDVQRFQKDKLIIGTVRNGIYVVSSQGKILSHLEKSNGLLDNTIRKVFTDLNHNIWLGLENGITYIQINSNTNYLLDTDGKIGTVYNSQLQDSLLYLGTNQGLFVKNISKPKSQPNIIDVGLGQIWQIEKIDNQILVGSHEGVFSLENKKLKTIHIEGGAWLFRKHPKLNDVLYVGFYSGIGVFKRINNKWEFYKKWKDYGESSRFMEFDRYGQLWVAHPTKGYYRLRLSDNGLELKGFEFYGITNKFVKPFAYICKIDNDLVFYNPNGFFNYDPLQNTFVRAQYPSALFKDIKNINSIYQYDNLFWYSTSKSLGYISRKGNVFTNIEEPFYYIRNKHLNDFNKFNRINDSTFGIGIKNGMVFHNINHPELENHKVMPIIKYIELISTTDTIMASTNQKEVLEIPRQNNFIKVSIALPKMPLGNSKRIQYRLIGLNKKWSQWEYLTELNFPGLSYGDYVLELRSGGENEVVSETVIKKFFVRPPWYLSKFAYFFYVLLLILINYVYRNYYKRKAQKQLANLKLEEELKRQSQIEKFEIERLESERKMLLLREENLNLEIKKKNSELASSTLNNIKKNELLTDLVTEITKIEQNILNSSLQSPIKKVLKKINTSLEDRDDWITFELHFRNAHADFFEKLREKHPDLTSSEIKLSAYLKINLSSKEIAALMHISIKSIEQNRYRLRKKLNIDQSTNLVTYIQTF